MARRTQLLPRGNRSNKYGTRRYRLCASWEEHRQKASHGSLEVPKATGSPWGWGKTIQHVTRNACERQGGSGGDFGVELPLTTLAKAQCAAHDGWNVTGCLGLFCPLNKPVTVGCTCPITSGKSCGRKSWNLVTLTWTLGFFQNLVTVFKMITSSLPFSFVPDLSVLGYRLPAVRSITKASASRFSYAKNR